MVGTGNLFFDVSTEVGQEIFNAKKESMKATPVEFGKQKATAQQWKKTIQENQSFKETELERLGMKGFLAQWRGRDGL
jgi:hypothetical protein